MKSKLSLFFIVFIRLFLLTIRRLGGRRICRNLLHYHSSHQAFFTCRGRAHAGEFVGGVAAYSQFRVGSKRRSYDVVVDAPGLRDHCGKSRYSCNSRNLIIELRQPIIDDQDDHAPVEGLDVGLGVVEDSILHKHIQCLDRLKRDESV